ncbi:zinc-dependent alcohol dehydrogenase family protein [Bacillus sp. JJ1533]|uniref:zinc-dependent alcohol dehydrogenase family protein n=2 Tax=Bacillales TaxID=1385 RepID=UPI002FFE6337
MKAAVLIDKMKMEIQELPVPAPADHEVIVKVKACGICGTDQHIYHGQPGSAEVQYPIVLGHELAGEVVKVGAKVTSLTKGDRVSIDPNMYCGECEFCRGGRPHLCDDLQAVGVTRNGGMGEYCAVPSPNCYLLPDKLSYEEGAMIEPLGCVLHGVSQLKFWPGASVLIIGGGYIGLMMLQMAKIYGTKVTISEPDQKKHEVASELGADQTVTPAELENLSSGFDLVIECVGRKDSMTQAVQMARKGGSVLLFGVSAPDTNIEVNPYEIFSKELTIKGSFINPHTHEQAIALVEQGKVQIKPLLSHRFTMDELPVIMKEYPRLKVVKGIVVGE